MSIKHASTTADFCWAASSSEVKILLSAFSEESRCCAHHHAEAELRVVEVTCLAVKWNNAEFGHVTVEKLAIQ